MLKPASLREHLTAAASALHAAGDRRHLALVHSLSGVLLAQSGRHDEALAALRRAAAQAERTRHDVEPFRPRGPRCPPGVIWPDWPTFLPPWAIPPGCGSSPRSSMRSDANGLPCFSSHFFASASLFFHAMRSEDRIAVKPHASPVFHAIQYLLGNQTRENLINFRALGGAQSYPSRTKDQDDVDFSTGSVGLGVAVDVGDRDAHRKRDSRGPHPRRRHRLRARGWPGR